MIVYSRLMAAFAQAPTWLVVLGITSVSLGAVILVLLGWHVVRRLLDVPRVPRGAGMYTLLVGLCALSIAAGVTTLAVAAALGDWQAQVGPAAMAEVQCRRVAPSRAELSVVTLDANGRRGRPETQTIDARPCEVAVERLHFLTPLARLGLMERHRVSRMGAVPRPIATPVWRALPQPLGLPIAAADAQQLAIPSEDGTPYRIIADDGGVHVEKLR